MTMKNVSNKLHFPKESNIINILSLYFMLKYFSFRIQQINMSNSLKYGQKPDITAISIAVK